MTIPHSSSQIQSSVSGLKTTGQVEERFPERGSNLNTGIERCSSLDIMLTFMDVEGECAF